MKTAKKMKPKFVFKMSCGYDDIAIVAAYTKSEARAEFKRFLEIDGRLPPEYLVEKVVPKKEGAK